MHMIQCIDNSHFESVFLPPLFLTEKHLYFWSFLDTLYKFFLHKKIPKLMIEKKRYSTTNSVQCSGLHKAQSALENRKAPCTLQWKVHPGQFQPYGHELNS